MPEQDPTKPSAGSVLQAIARLFPLTTLVIKLQLGCLFVVVLVLVVLALVVLIAVLAW